MHLCLKVFDAHKKFEDTVAGLLELSPRTEQKQSLQQLRSSEADIFRKVAAADQTSKKLRGLTSDFVLLVDSTRTFSADGDALIEWK